MEKKPEWLSIPLNLVTNLQKVVESLIHEFTWGKSSHQSLITVEDVENWFYDLPSSIIKKIDRGVVLRIVDVEETIRIYQGVFDTNWKCISARQLIVDKISPELDAMLTNNDMAIYSQNPEII